MASTWLQNQNPQYAAALADRELAQAFYAGQGTAAYLRQYAQGESLKAYEERRALTHCDAHLGLVVDSVAGMLRPDQATRDWGVLGDAQVPGTAAYGLWRDADGTGTPYTAWLHQAAVELVLTGEAWILSDPTTTAVSTPAGGDGAVAGPVRPRLTLLPTLACTDWVETAAGGVVQALTREAVDGRTSVTEAPKLVDQHVLYGTEGWARYQERDGRVVTVAEAGYSESGRTYVTRSGEPTAPVIRIQLPFRRRWAAQLASAARSLYTQRSDRDALQRAASYPRLVLSASDTEYDEIVAGLAAGSNVMRLDPSGAGRHEFVSPSMDGVTVANATLALDEARFYRTAWRMLEAEGQAQRTATEAVLDRSNGLASALALIGSAMEEVERGALYLCEQAVSDRPADWTSDVTWPTDYSRVELEVPGPVPPATEQID